jgi:putative ABC transport system permease protein
MATALAVSLFPIARAVAIGEKAGLASSATGHRSTSRAQNFLLGGQIVLALVLVATSYGSWATFAKASDFDRLGFRWEGRSAALAHPRILDAAVTRPLSLVGGERNDEGTTVRVGGVAEPLSGPAVPRSSLAVSPGYFGLNEIAIVAGRPITSADDAAAPPAAVVSADAAARLWPGHPPASALGETVEFARGGVSEFVTVVGVAAPVVQDPTADAGRHDPRIYLSILQTPDDLYGEGDPTLQLRAATGGAPLTHDEWAAWVPVAVPGAAVSGVFQIQDILRQSIHGLAALVLALVAIGVYGTVSYRIASIRHEIGIRLALGADAAQVVRTVVAPLARVVVISVSVGSGLAVATIPILAAGGLPVAVTGSLTLLVVSLVTVGTTALAAWTGPLRSALKTDPSLSLRTE